MRTCSVLDVLRLVRAHNLVVAAVGVLAGGWIALGALATPTLLVFAAAAAVAFGAAGNAVNDIWDTDADRVNRRPGERPLAGGRLSRGTADLCVAGGTLLGVGAAALVSGAAVLVGLGALAVLLAYSPILKRRGFAGNLAVALVAGLPLQYGALAVGRPAAGVVPWALAAWLHLVREIVKDLGDGPGDRGLGPRTRPGASGAGAHAVRAVPSAHVDARCDSPARAAGRARGDHRDRRGADRRPGARRPHLALPARRRLARRAVPPAAHRAGDHRDPRRLGGRRHGRCTARRSGRASQMAQRCAARRPQTRRDSVRGAVARGATAMARRGRRRQRAQCGAGGGCASRRRARGAAPGRAPARCARPVGAGVGRQRDARPGALGAGVRRLRGA